MDIGPIFSPEIGFTISGENRLNLGPVNKYEVGLEDQVAELNKRR